MTAAIDRRVYGELAREALPRVVRTGEANDAALTTISRLRRNGDALVAEERELLDLTVGLAEHFEAEAYPSDDAAPLDVSRELLASNGLRQDDLVPDVGSRGVV